MKSGLKLISLFKNAAMIHRCPLLLVFLTTITFTVGGQSSPERVTPNKFHGFSLGSPLSAFSPKNIKNSKSDFLILFSDIKTKTMKHYTLKDQLTEGGDKIDLDFFFYNDSLSVIRVGYKDKQANKELLNALRGKYGNDDRLEHDLYNDPSTGASRVIENSYWEKSACCILNITSTDAIGLVYITFAEKAAQTKLRDQEIINNQKRIN